MDLIISGRHCDIDSGAREYTETKMQKLAGEYPKLTSVRVVVDTERGWVVTEIHANGKNLTLDARARSREMLPSIEAAAEKIERQLRKYLERIQDHRSPRHGLAAEAAGTEAVPDEDADELGSDADALSA